jgi:hypothetical protein
MMAHYINDWYRIPGGCIWSLFEPKVTNHVHLAEDYQFCRKWKDMGGELWLYPDTEFSHIGQKEYKGSFQKTVLGIE